MVLVLLVVVSVVVVMFKINSSLYVYFEFAWFSGLILEVKCKLLHILKLKCFAYGFWFLECVGCEMYANDEFFY